MYRHLSDSELEEKLREGATSYLEFYEATDNLANLPNPPRHVSLHIEDTMCNFKRWANIAEAFLEAKQKGRPQDFQGFHNLHRGRFWEFQRRRALRVQAELPLDEYLLREVPPGVTFLTAWADVQGDRIELGIYGWGAGRENWVIDRIILHGDPSREPVWAAGCDNFGAHHHDSALGRKRAVSGLLRRGRGRPLGNDGAGVCAAHQLRGEPQARQAGCRGNPDQGQQPKPDQKRALPPLARQNWQQDQAQRGRIAALDHQYLLLQGLYFRGRQRPWLAGRQGRCGQQV